MQNSTKDVNDNLAGSTKQYITDLDKLQRLTGTSAEALQKQQEEKSFRSDPHKFASNLFKNQQTNDAPTFSAEEAEAYFKQTYRDNNRDHVYTPLTQFECPELPSHLFLLCCPTENELK